MNKPTKAIAALCLLNSANLYALGVGEIETYSALNQVLRAKIPLISSKSEDPSNVRIGIASREVFKKSGIDRPHYLTEIKFTPVLNKQGEITIEVLSNSTIKEPFVNFILEIEWPKGRTLKEFTILLDPPVTMSDLQPAPVVLASSSKKKANVAVVKSRNTTVKAVQQYGPTKSNDTIWGIAKALAPSNSPAEHQKVMLALYDNNPKAFYKKNINALKKGAILQAPSQQQINSRTAAQASAHYNEQNSLWSSTSSSKATAKTSQANKKTAATSSSKKEQKNASEGQLTLLTTSKQSSTDVTVEGNSVDTPTGSNNPETKANMALEMATTLEAENNDVKSRLSDLESQVEKLHRLIALKDKQLALLQSTKSAESITKTQAPVAVEPPLAEKAPVPESSDDNLPLYAGGGLLLALLGLVLARRKKQGKTDKGTTTFTTNDLPEETNIEEPTDDSSDDDFLETSNTAAAEEELLLSEFTPSEFNTSSQTQEADPLTECDVYIAYGRYQQAQDLIETALKTEPSNLSYKLKLLDVYFASGQADDFESLAKELTEIQQSDTDTWNNIAIMGAELRPDSPLFTTVNSPIENNEIKNIDEIVVEQEQDTNDNEIEFNAVETDDEIEIEASDIIDSDDNNKQAENDDSNEFEFDFNLIKNEQTTPSEESPADSESTLDDIFAEENSEDTKISLAQAYIEMEDHASARESLESVLETGNDEQKQRAQEMLNKL